MLSSSVGDCYTLVMRRRGLLAIMCAASLAALPASAGAASPAVPIGGEAAVVRDAVTTFWKTVSTDNGAGICSLMTAQLQAAIQKTGPLKGNHSCAAQATAIYKVWRAPVLTQLGNGSIQTAPLIVRGNNAFTIFPSSSGKTADLVFLENSGGKWLVASLPTENPATISAVQAAAAAYVFAVTYKQWQTVCSLTLPTEQKLFVQQERSAGAHVSTCTAAEALAYRSAPTLPKSDATLLKSVLNKATGSGAVVIVNNSAAIKFTTAASNAGPAAAHYWIFQLVSGHWLYAGPLANQT